MYDCGKMNTMINLLIRLKQKGDKVLIFTQVNSLFINSDDQNAGYL